MKISGSGQAEALSKEDFHRVLDQLVSPHHRLIFALAWYTTERPGALLQLRVEQVYRDPEKGQPLEKIVIPGGIRKDGKTREVPVAAALKWELKHYRPPRSGYLFPGRGGRPISFSAYDKALRRVFSRLGLRGYSTYSTRRGALTHLARSGFSARRIQQLSGHASLSALQRYLEVSDAEIEATIAVL